MPMLTKPSVIILFLLVNMGWTYAQTPVPSAQAQIKAATMAAPQDKREEATVYGFNEKKDWVILRKGTNDMICVADDPDEGGLDVSCYHKDLHPFMERGRALRKQGKTSKEIFDIREKEAKSGALKMPRQASTLFVYSAEEENFTSATGEVKDGYLRYVIYIPFATSETTGLPTKPVGPGAPWIMDAGTHKAHIMINPPSK